LHLLGFKLMATEGTANYLKHVGLPVERVNKISDGSPHVVDMMTAGRIDLLINTPLGGQAHEEGAVIRAAAVSLNIPIITTMSAAAASVQGMKALKSKPLKVRSLQRHHHPV
ncbi:MAG: hypothetical protein WA009_04085, partial [Phototrophicaceae bacterium]